MTPGMDHYIFMLFLHPPEIFVLTVADKGSGAGWTSDPAVDVD